MAHTELVVATGFFEMHSSPASRSFIKILKRTAGPEMGWGLFSVIP